MKRSNEIKKIQTAKRRKVREEEEKKDGEVNGRQEKRNRRKE